MEELTLENYEIYIYIYQNVSKASEEQNFNTLY